MIRLSYVLDQSGASLDEEDAAELEALSDLAEDNVRWQKEVFKKYAQEVDPLARLSLSHIVFPNTDPVEIDLELNNSLFIQISKLYLYWGWPTINSIYNETYKLNFSEDVKGLVRDTCNFLRERISLELSRVEGAASQFADRKWSATVDTLTEWQSFFKNLYKEKYVFSEPSVATKLMPLFSNYQALYKKLTSSIRERSAASKYAADYVPGENDDLFQDLYRTWGKQELSIRDQMKTAAKDIGAICPPALFALQASTSIFAKKDTNQKFGFIFDHSFHESELATEIWSLLQRSIEELNQRIKNLKSEGVAAIIASSGGLPKDIYVNGAHSLPGAEATVAYWSLKEWGVAAKIKGILTLENGDIFQPSNKVLKEENNNIMCFGELLLEYKINQSLTDGCSFQRCVLTHFVHALDSEINIRHMKSEQLASALKVFRWIAAIISIIAVIALIVVSGGALLPSGVVTICAIIQFTDTAINLALLVLLAFESKLMDEENKKLWQEAVAELNKKDINTINEVGASLLRLHTSRMDISKQLVALLITMKGVKYNEKILSYYGLSNKMNLVQRAVEIENLAGDLDNAVNDADSLETFTVTSTNEAG